LLFEEGFLKNKKYEKIKKGITITGPYISITKEDLLECLGHEDAIQKILAALKNRKDADEIFISAIIKSWKFWACILGSSIILCCVINYLFFRFPFQTTHVIEKAINAGISDLMPIPQH
jgi:hypothetical protein